MQAMVVDDSKAMRTILRRILEEIGYEDILEAGNGAEALDVLVGVPAPQLVLVDWNMPEMTGIDFVRAARADERFRDTAIVMITTETAVERIEDALAAGANDYVMKPFTKDVLVDRLQFLGIDVG